MMSFGCTSSAKASSLLPETREITDERCSIAAITVSGPAVASHESYNSVCNTAHRIRQSCLYTSNALLVLLLVVSSRLFFFLFWREVIFGAPIRAIEIGEAYFQ